MNNTVSLATEDLYVEIDDLTGGGETLALEKNNGIMLESSVYHELDEGDSYTSYNCKSDENADHISHKSEIDWKEKSVTTNNKAEKCGQKIPLKREMIPRKKGKIFDNDLIRKGFVFFILASISMICVILIIVIAVTYWKIYLLEERLMETDVSVKDFNLSIEQIKKMTDVCDTQQNPLFSPCLEVIKIHPTLSDDYQVKSLIQYLVSICCSNSTGWIKIAKLNVNNCPQGMKSKKIDSADTCVVTEFEAGCTKIQYPVYSMQYSTVLGKLQAYQNGTLDGFISHNATLRSKTATSNNLSSNYLDGVSITADGQHVWSFAAGCDCRSNKPTFIGERYICDGITHPQSGSGGYNNFLWKHQQCERNSSWFVSDLNHTTANIEVKICRDQNRTDEDLAMTSLELYIQ